MTGPEKPFEPRRRKELRAELLERARAWLPDWRPRDEEPDAATALFEIAARLESEVTQRLDRVPEKVFRGFLYWLGLRGEPGRAARVPVVFSMAPGAEPVLAHPPVQVQATPTQTDTAQAADPITFETDRDLMVSRGTLATVVGVDPAKDALFLPHAGFSRLEPPAARPDLWRNTSDAQQGATDLQLEPALGLDSLPTLVHIPSGNQYRVVKADGTLVTLDPPLKQDIPQGNEFRGNTAFDPFGDHENNRQEHALYIGSTDVLNIPAAARIAIRSLGADGTNAEWSYWGKSAADDEPGWRKLSPPALEKGDVVLSKPEGSVEITKIGDKESRWLRAVHNPPVSGSGSAVSHLQLTVNCGGDDPAHACPPTVGQRSTVAVEAIANTTPLVLDIPFLPLGREPKLFDAFYVGSPEAFSKPNAYVELCLEASDTTTESLVAASVGPDTLLFGVGHGQLHRLKATGNPAAPFDRLPSVRPPFADNGIASVPAPSTPLENVPAGSQLSTASRSDDTFVAVTAGNDGWLWRQHKQPGQSRWIALGAIHDLSAGPVPAYSSAEPSRLYVLRDGADLRVIGINHEQLFEARVKPDAPGGPGPVWKAVEEPAPRKRWTHVMPVFSLDQPLRGADLGDGWLAADKTGGVAVFLVNSTGDSEFSARLSRTKADPALQPVAIATPGADVTIVTKVAGDLVAWSLDDDDRISSVDGAGVLDAVGWTSDKRTVLAVLFVQESTAQRRELATWFPLDDSPAYLSETFDRGIGGPAVLEDRVAVPGTNGAVLSFPFAVTGFPSAELDASQVESALVIASTTPPFAVDDFVETKIKNEDPIVTQLKSGPVQNGANRYWLRLTPSKIHKDFVSAAIYRVAVTQQFTGSVASAAATDVTAETNDQRAKNHTHLVIGTGTAPAVLSVHEIDDVDDTTTPWTITLKTRIKNVAKGDPISYVYVKTGAAGTILPFLDVALVDANVVAAAIAKGVYLERFKPAPNPLAFADPVQPPATGLVLSVPWTARPPAGTNKVTLIGDAFYGPLTIVEQAKAGTPALSWEYWDGSAWWKIQDLNDGTGGLQQTGLVTFCVPEGLKPTDVAGRTSHWIRARLIAGDYGKESVTITSKVDPNDPKVTTQTIDRSLAGVTPPQLASVDLRYSVCCPSFPDYVITRDGNALRDQTAANEIDGAAIELFVPLAETIRAAAGGTTSPGDAGRAVYLGFDEQLEGGPITVLFLIDEGQHDAAFPLEVEVLGERGFARVTAEDGTRGLNESGILTFTLAAPAPAVALFGETRYWVRVRPNDRFDATQWRPRIRAAFLNGAWAFAAETQALERLGSSDGSPNQRVSLARPPVIKDSLELRVREPLGDEDVEALRQIDPSSVIDELPNGGRGKWVRWANVVDLTEGGKDSRIYSLDHESGEIAFGDGQNGKIPPIGADSIVAVRYRRGGGDAANRVTAWSQLTPITPIPGVQTVAAPEGAAGGTDPEPPASVVRFAPANLGMRSRALTLADLETSARQFSPAVAQARAFDSRRGIRVVVAMRGQNPLPSAAQRRELTRFLAGKTLPMLAERGAIAVEQPGIVRVRVRLELSIDRIEFSGAVTREVRSRIETLLDPAIGGVDGGGWPLGEVPAESDVAAAIASVEHLEEIHRITVVDNATGARLTRVAPDKLVAPAPDGIVAQLAVVEEDVA